MNTNKFTLTQPETFIQYGLQEVQSHMIVPDMPDMPIKM